MDDFGAFCYLDVQKTGSTFISKTLRAVSRCSLLASGRHTTIEPIKHHHLWPVLRYEVTGQASKNGPTLGGVYRPGCFYFNSVRNPFDYYTSLYNYGCDGRGGLAGALRKRGFGDLYDLTEAGFLGWMDFVLDPENAHLCNLEYGKTCGPAVGFLTFRFLRLSCADPLSKLDGLQTMDEAISMYNRYNICRATIQQEKLNVDLDNLFKNQLRKYVIEDAATYLSDARRINESKSGIVDGDFLRRSRVAQRVIERELLVFREFYPDFMS